MRQRCNRRGWGRCGDPRRERGFAFSGDDPEEIGARRRSDSAAFSSACAVPFGSWHMLGLDEAQVVALARILTRSRPNAPRRRSIIGARDLGVRGRDRSGGFRRKTRPGRGLDSDAER